MPEMTLLEPGLWSDHPGECWALEERMMAKQEAPFRLRAPDEEEARAAYEREHPEKARARVLRMEELRPKQGGLGL